MGKSKSPPGLSSLLDRLSPAEALTVLRQLARDKVLAARIREAVETLLASSAPKTQQDVENIAEVVLSDLEGLDVDAVWEQAGPRRDGYVDTDEVAARMIEEAVSPYLENVARYQNLGRDLEAAYLCMGVLKGLYRFEQDSTSEFKDWAPDAPGECAEAALTSWRQGGVTRKAARARRAFIEESLPHWKAHLAPLIRWQRKTHA